VKLVRIISLLFSYFHLILFLSLLPGNTQGSLLERVTSSREPNKKIPNPLEGQPQIEVILFSARHTIDPFTCERMRVVGEFVEKVRLVGISVEVGGSVRGR